jgi:hypothetical protein
MACSRQAILFKVFQGARFRITDQSGIILFVNTCAFIGSNLEADIASIETDPPSTPSTGKVSAHTPLL